MHTAARRFIWVVVATSLLGCSTNINDVDVEVSESFSFEVDAGAAVRLTVENVNGRVQVIGEPGSVEAPP